MLVVHVAMTTMINITTVTNVTAVLVGVTAIVFFLVPETKNVTLEFTRIPKLNLVVDAVEWGMVSGADQVTSTDSNFGEVGNFAFKILWISGLRVFNPPQLSDRCRTMRRPERPRMAPQVKTMVRSVAGSR